MQLRICPILCCAILIGFAATAQASGTRSSGDTLEDLEGSGSNEVKGDLESSGSGLGPDDEDTTPTPSIPKIAPKGDDERNVNGRAKIVPPEENKPVQLEPIEPTVDTGVKMNPKLPEDRHTSFFAQPGILAAVIGGAVVGLLCAILVVMFIVYRMRKKDEGSYALGEPKQSPTANTYNRGGNSKEFYA